MFKKALEADLKIIFGVKKVIFSDVDTASEQDIVFVSVSNAIVKVTDNKATARVYGDIKIKASIEKMQTGFFQKCIDKAPHKIRGRFFFTRVNQNRPLSFMEKQFNCPMSDFVYFYREEYNPVKVKILFLNLTVNFEAVVEKLKKAVKQTIERLLNE